MTTYSERNEIFVVAILFVTFGDMKNAILSFEVSFEVGLFVEHSSNASRESLTEHLYLL